MAPPEITVTVTTGDMKTEPVQYWIETAIDGPWWWRQQIFYVCSEYGKMGPFYTRRDAETAKAMCSR